MTENENITVSEVTAPESEHTDEAASQTTEQVQSAPTADDVNVRNASLSTGSVTDDGRGAVFFTAADVRAMSREQVRANLPKILKSMECPDF